MQTIYDPLGDGISRLELIDHMGTDESVVRAAGKLERLIRRSYDRGYRVTPDGVLIGLKGKPLPVRKRGKQSYPTFSVSTSETVCKVFGIPVHKFAAFCFYGSAVFEPGIVVRHKNGNVYDVSAVNILIGSHSQNNLDKPAATRMKAAKLARAAQGYRAYNALFTDDQIRGIRLRAFKRGEKAALARELGVAKTTITDILKRRIYADVD